MMMMRSSLFSFLFSYVTLTSPHKYVSKRRLLLGSVLGVYAVASLQMVQCVKLFIGMQTSQLYKGREDRAFEDSIDWSEKCEIFNINE